MVCFVWFQYVSINLRKENSHFLVLLAWDSHFTQNVPSSRLSARTLRPLSLDLQLMTNLSKHWSKHLQPTQRTFWKLVLVLFQPIWLDSSCAGRYKGFQIFVECLRFEFLYLPFKVKQLQQLVYPKSYRSCGSHC